MALKLNTKEFIKRARAVHGNRYSYKKTEYLKSTEALVITCKIHGDFSQKPSGHLAGNGCSLCGRELLAKKQSSNTPKFIEKAKKIHSNFYIYTKTEYVNAKTPVKIRCPKHGFFMQTPSSHLGGRGCIDCGKESFIKKKTRSREEFIRLANKKHKNAFLYKKVIYIKTTDKIIITCPKHGDFTQTPDSHLAGHGCNKCSTKVGANKQRGNLREFIKKSNLIHKNFYSYKKSKYQTALLDVIITCPIHGDFPQKAGSHLAGVGCPKCAIIKNSNKRRYSKNTILKFFRDIHGEEYDYSEVHYKNYHSRVKIICYQHGPFLQSPANHIKGSGCNRCILKAEGRIAKYLLAKNIVYRQFQIKHKNKIKYFDFLLPDLNLLIERDGEQHYKFVSLFANKKENYLKKQHKNDIIKTKIAKKAGLKIARIPYWLSPAEEKIEIENILIGNPTYPDIPDLKHEKTKPRPIKNF